MAVLVGFRETLRAVNWSETKRLLVIADDGLRRRAAQAGVGVRENLPLGPLALPGFKFSTAVVRVLSRSGLVRTSHTRNLSEVALSLIRRPGSVRAGRGALCGDSPDVAGELIGGLQIQAEGLQWKTEGYKGSPYIYRGVTRPTNETSGQRSHREAGTQYYDAPPGATTDVEKNIFPSTPALCQKDTDIRGKKSDPKGVKARMSIRR